MALGSQIRHYREGMGWTLEKLSELAGVEIGTIGALEARDSSRSQYSSALAVALGLTVEQLLDHSTDYLPQLKAGTPIGVHGSKHNVAPAHRWPFRDIAPGDWWDLLDSDARMLVEVYARGMLDAARARPKRVANS